MLIGSFRDGCRRGEKKQSWRCSRGNQYPKSACRSVLSLQSKEEGLDEERVRTEPFRGKRRSSGEGDLFEDAPMEVAACVRVLGGVAANPAHAAGARFTSFPCAAENYSGPGILESGGSCHPCAVPQESSSGVPAGEDLSPGERESEDAFGRARVSVRGHSGAAALVATLF